MGSNIGNNSNIQYSLVVQDTALFYFPALQDTTDQLMNEASAYTNDDSEKSHHYFYLTKALQYLNTGLLFSQDR